MSPQTPSSLGRSMAEGAGWSVALRIADRAIGLVSLSILARLLLPEDFGLVALAVSFIALVEMFGQFGVELALIRNQHAGREQYDGAWSINIMTAAGVSLALVLLASSAANFFQEPRLEAIVYWLALAHVIRSLENIGVVDFRKHFQFEKEFAYLFSARVLSTIATLAMALYWREYWALVAGSVAYAAIRVALSYRVHPYRPAFALTGVNDIFHFSKWVLVQNVIHGVNERASAIAIGKFSDAQALAHYNVAFEISNVATSELAAPIRRAIYPGFSKMAADVASLRQGFVRTFAVIALVGLPIPVGIALTAEPIVAVLLGDKWLAAVPLIQVLALHGVVRTLGTGSHLVYLALGHPRTTAFLSTLRLLVLTPLLVYGTREAGAIGAAWAMLISAVLLWAVDVGILFRVLRLKPSELASATWRPALSALLMSGAVYGMQLALPNSESLLSAAWQLFASVALGAVAYVSANYGLWRACRCPEGAESMIQSFLRGRRAER